MKKPGVRPKPSYGDLFASWEIAVVRSLVYAALNSDKHLQGYLQAEDLELDCLVRWHEVRDSYDTSRGASRKTFLGIVARNMIQEVIRKATTDLRRINYEADPISVLEAVAEEEDLPPWESRMVDSGYSDPTDEFLTRLTVDELLDCLSPRQRRIVEARANGEDISALAKELGVHRSTIYEEEKRLPKGLMDNDSEKSS